MPLSNLPNELLMRVFRDTTQEESCVVASKAYRGSTRGRSKYESKYKFILLSPQFSAFGPSSGLDQAYREVHGDHIFKSAPLVHINVVDLKANNLKAFLTQLKKANRLHDFRSAGPRAIRIFHSVTSAFSDDAAGFTSFVRIISSCDSEENGGINIQHTVAECDDVWATLRMARMLDTLSSSAQLKSMRAAFRRHYQAQLNQIEIEKDRAEMQRSVYERSFAAGPIIDNRDEDMAEDDAKENEEEPGLDEVDSESVYDSTSGNMGEVDPDGSEEDTRAGAEEEDELESEDEEVEQNEFSEDDEEEGNGQVSLGAENDNTM